jgi:hypothetical protein
VVGRVDDVCKFPKPQLAGAASCPLPPSVLYRHNNNLHLTYEICRYPEWMFNLTNDFFHHVYLEEQSSLLNTTATKSTCLGCGVLRTASDLTALSGGPKQDRKYPTHIHEQKGHLSILDGRQRLTSIDVFTFPDKPSIPAVRVAPPLPRAHFKDNLGLITSWLEKCQREHVRCRDATNFVPRRLLAISSEHSMSLLEQPTLVTAPEEDRPSIRYACLSHCWGHTRSKHITTTSNLSTNLQSIPIEELPLTFRDAITIVRSLGIFHLWIDSLCIVQDDAADWEHHVESMADIYRNAYITLAAGGSVDDDGGFFVDGDHKYNQTRTLQIYDEESVPINLQFRLLPPHPNSWSSDHLAASPLEQRGWISQERFLSRRFLCFSENEIQWECLDDVACTCSSINGGFNARYGSSDEFAFPECLPVKWRLARLNDLKKDEISNLWLDMVSVYTQTLLTFGKDKLPALAGLAKAFAEASGNTYAFGHWRETLHHEITWGRFCSDASFGRPRPDVPSWSWAAAADSSIIGWSRPVSWRTTTFEVIGIEGKNLTLYVLVSSIRLGVLTVPKDYKYPNIGKLEHYCTLCQLTEPGSIVSKIKGFLDKALKGSPTTALPSLEVLTSQQHWSFAADYRFWNNVEELQTSLEEVYFLDLTGPAGYVLEDGAVQVEGMILRKTEVGTYERLGILVLMPFSELPHRTIFHPMGRGRQ